MKDNMIIDVRVNSAVREFIISTKGSDIIVPEKRDWIWLLLKQKLIPAPIGATQDIPEEELIRVSLLDASGSKVYAQDVDRTIYMNTLFRFWLDKKGQYSIARHLNTQFKECFHNFMAGAIFTNPAIKQKDAVDDFCECYNISYDKITFDMLFKSWQRSSQRNRILKGESNECPIVF